MEKKHMEDKDLFSEIIITGNKNNYKKYNIFHALNWHEDMSNWHFLTKLEIQVIADDKGMIANNRGIYD